MGIQIIGLDLVTVNIASVDQLFDRHVPFGEGGMIACTHGFINCGIVRKRNAVMATDVTQASNTFDVIVIG